MKNKYIHTTNNKNKLKYIRHIYPVFIRIRTILFIGLLILLSVHFSYGQLQSNGAIRNMLAYDHPFLDASRFAALHPTNGIGKGLYFPTTDLTQWRFHRVSLDGVSFPTAFDGLLVYNTGTGQTLTNPDEGIQVDVTPGFYYFYNPTGTNDVSTGQWIRLRTEAMDTDTRLDSIDVKNDTTFIHFVDKMPVDTTIMKRLKFNTHITEDHDFYAVGTSSTPTDIKQDLWTKGSLVINSIGTWPLIIPKNNGLSIIHNAVNYGNNSFVVSGRITQSYADNSFTAGDLHKHGAAGIGSPLTAAANVIIGMSIHIFQRSAYGCYLGFDTRVTETDLTYANDASVFQKGNTVISNESRLIYKKFNNANVIIGTFGILTGSNDNVSINHIIYINTGTTMRTSSQKLEHFALIHNPYYDDPDTSFLLTSGMTENTMLLYPGVGKGVGINTVEPDSLFTVNGTTSKTEGGDVWANPSDIRIKENIQPYTKGFTYLRQLRPISFNYKPEMGWTTETHVGLIAQEVEEVLPSMVETVKEKKGIPDFKNVNASEIKFLLINTMKELHAEKETINDKITELESENKRLLEQMQKIAEAMGVADVVD